MATTSPLSAWDETPENLENLRRMGRAWREIRRGATASAVRDIVYGIGGSALEPGQLDALDIIINEENVRMGDLADRLRIDPSTATRAVQRLIKDGLAERSTLDSDGRVVTVVASEKGIRLYNEAAQRRREVLVGIMERFPEHERAQLADMFEKFVAALDDVVRTKTRRR